MKNFFKKNFKLHHIIGIVLGAVAGYIYYYKVGCKTGVCPLKSNPYTMVLYGVLLGYLLVDFMVISYKKIKEYKNIINEDDTFSHEENEEK